MRVKINGETREFFTIWRNGGDVNMIDQRLLPHRFEILTLHGHRETAEAIRDMSVRGAGAIGVAAGYGIAQAAIEAKEKKLNDFISYLSEAASLFRKTRPTAINLFHAIDRCIEASSSGSVSNRVRAICAEADKIALDDLEASKKIGEYGNTLIGARSQILTHCNAGALAFIDNGSALAPIRVAYRSGKSIFVYVDETRPRSQGAKLTTWELQQEEIPYALIVDNAAGHYMQLGKIDLVIVGADRIAANGDTANKIGTYEKAVLARENGVPFYVAAPRSTFDINCPTGKAIEIEERSSDEINLVSGVDENGVYRNVRISSEGTTAFNPSFDVTPSKYINGFITDVGVIKPPFIKGILEAINSKTCKNY